MQTNCLFSTINRTEPHKTSVCATWGVDGAESDATHVVYDKNCYDIIEATHVFVRVFVRGGTLTAMFTFASVCVCLFLRRQNDDGGAAHRDPTAAAVAQNLMANIFARRSVLRVVHALRSCE